MHAAGPNGFVTASHLTRLRALEDDSSKVPYQKTEVRCQDGWQSPTAAEAPKIDTTATFSCVVGKYEPIVQLEKRTSFGLCQAPELQPLETYTISSSYEVAPLVCGRRQSEWQEKEATGVSAGEYYYCCHPP